MRIVVTRPAAQARDWVDALRRRGLDALALPLIDIQPAADGAAVSKAWISLVDHDLVFFVSPNAIDRFFAAAPAGSGWPAGLPAATPGPGSAAALRRQGVAETDVLTPPAEAPSFDTAALWQLLRERDWRGRSVLIVRGDGGREELTDLLRAAGAKVTALCAYRRRAPDLDKGELALLAAAMQDPQDWLWLFSSSEAIDNLDALAPAWDRAAAQALATHPRIADTARRQGFGTVRTCTPSIAAVAASIEGWSIQSPPT